MHLVRTDYVSNEQIKSSKIDIVEIIKKSAAQSIRHELETSNNLARAIEYNLSPSRYDKNDLEIRASIVLLRPSELEEIKQVAIAEFAEEIINRMEKYAETMTDEDWHFMVEKRAKLRGEL